MSDACVLRAPQPYRFQALQGCLSSVQGSETAGWGCRGASVPEDAPVAVLGDA